MQEREGQRSPFRVGAARNMGLALISIGVFVLAAGSWQHWRFLQQLKSEADHGFASKLMICGFSTIGDSRWPSDTWPFAIANGTDY